MKTETVILGCDLGVVSTQISVLRPDQKEPETISTISGEDKFQIPTMVGKVRDSDKWVFGTEAKKLTVLQEGTAVDRLPERCLEKETIEIEGTSYEPVWLLSNFLGQLMQFVRRMVGNSQIACLMFTVPEITEDISTVIRTAASRMGIARELICIQDYQESFYHFVVNGEKELWNHNVALFRYENNQVDYYELSCSLKNRIQYIAVDKEGYMTIEPDEDHPDAEGNGLSIKKDQEFSGFVEKNFGKKLISSVYLIGEGFDGDWMEESLKVLCSGRRVFLGKNLYTKGACYGGAERIQGQRRPDRIYCGPHKVMSDIGVRMRIRGADEMYSLARAGRNWFDSGQACECILNGEKKIELEIHSFISGDQYTETISLAELPDRPQGTQRVRLELFFLSEALCKLVIRDVGFGEMYPATEFEKQYEITLNG